MKKDWMINESELDDIQYRLLTATLDRSCIVAGCAGSGKSILALLKAQRIQKERGTNYQVVVFTKTLRRYMATGRDVLGLTNKFYYHAQWQRRGRPGADYMIVDEIQDFSKEEILEFVSATNRQFFFFGDTAQSIFDGIIHDGVAKKTVPVDEIVTFVERDPKPKKFDLYNNYRLPIAVAKFSYQIGVGLDPFDEAAYKSPETAVPRIISYPDRDAQIAAIHRIIVNNQLDDVAILLPTNELVKSVYEKLSTMGGTYEMKYKSNDADDGLDFLSTNPKIMTYHSAKGLQFETVFVPFLESFSSDRISDRKPLYVAVTRTYRYLYGMWSGSLCPLLASAVNNCSCKTSETDEFEEI